MIQLPRLSGSYPPNNLSTKTFSKLRELIKELRYTPRSDQGVKISAVQKSTQNRHIRVASLFSKSLSSAGCFLEIFHSFLRCKAKCSHARFLLGN